MRPHARTLRAWGTLLVILALPPIHAFAQDSLTTFQELSFTSGFERQTFEKLQNRNVDYFSLFMANGALMREDKIAESQKKFYDHVAAVGASTAGKKNDKRVKAIYANLHQKFLTKYEQLNRFEEIFYNGYYNCVSATAMYGMAFEKLGIPYSIKEEPGHVYMVAYPASERILLETTSQMRGYYQISNEFKSRYLKIMRDQKLITAQEYNTNDVTTLFDKYYFANKGEITLLQLVALQYANDGIYLCDEKKFADAYHQFEKAYLLFPTDRIAYLLLSAGLQLFEAHPERDSSHAVLLAKLARFQKYDISPDMIEGEFAKSTKILLSEKNQQKSYTTYYKTLHGLLQDEKLKEAITFSYYYENGRWYYNQGKFKETLPYLEQNMLMRPTDMDTQGLFLQTLEYSLEGSSNAEIVKTLDAYEKRLSLLADNNRFNSMHASACLFEFLNNYQDGKPAAGEKYRALFEARMAKHPGLYISSNLIGESYSSAAVYYYRKGDVAKARQYLATGLKYAPNSYELTMRQRMIK